MAEIKKIKEIEFPQWITQNLVEEFIAKLPDVLDEIESTALAFENNPAVKAESIDKLMRVIHTIKGEAATLCFEALQELCHEVESRIEKNQESIECQQIIKFKDWMEDYLSYVTDKGGSVSSIDEFLKENFSPKKEAPKMDVDASPPSDEIDDKYLQPYDFEDPDIVVEFLTEADEHLEIAEQMLVTLDKSPNESEALNAVFRSFHTIKGTAGFLNLREVSDLAHKAETLLEMARNDVFVLENEALDAILESRDKMTELCDKVRGALKEQKSSLTPDKSTYKLINRIQEVIHSIQVHGKLPSATANRSTTDVSDDDSGASTTVKSVVVKETLKVDSGRLDRLIDTIGELVIAESMVGRHLSTLEMNDEQSSRDMQHLNKITRELQEMGMALRMVSVKSTFEKMARVVRDLTRKSGKKIKLNLTGEDTELDKGVVDKLGDPLIHMIRNACDHGLEDPGERIEAGKDEQGTVDLRAFYRGSNVVIEIEDNGRGLNKDKILAKAMEKGIVTENHGLSDSQIYDLIFAPGFSTAAKVTEVSGRGVGMDVVKRNIEALNGSIEIRSELGKGTQFAIVLPLTLAIMDGMVVRVAQEHYIVPTLSVVETLTPKADNFTYLMDRGETLNWRGKFLRVIRLGDLFCLCAHQENVEELLLCVIEQDGEYIALLVDELVGQQQVVIKTMGPLFDEVAGFAGGAIMPDGSVGLILDMGSVVKLSYESFQNKNNNDGQGSKADNLALPASMEEQPNPVNEG